MTPKLTIITPSFNQAAFIERTLESVLGRGYENLEYLIVDGGATDGSVDIIRRYKDRLAWWVSEPDGGQTEALDKGAAAGDRRRGQLHQLRQRVPARCVRDRDYRARADRCEVARRCLPLRGRGRVDHRGLAARTPTAPRHWWLLDPWGAPQPSTFWRREVFDELGPFCEDTQFAIETGHHLRLVMAGWMPELIEDELAVRVLHADAKSADKARWDDDLQKIRELYLGQLTSRERRVMVVQNALTRAGLNRGIDAAAPVTQRLRRAAAR